MSDKKTWMSRTIDGVEYCFDHLKTYRITVSRPARSPHAEMSFDLVVNFDCHVATEACGEPHEGPAYWRDSAGKCRVFDKRRYELSQALPSIIQAMVDGKDYCYEAKKNNYMVWKPAESNLADPPYLFFFDLYLSPEEKGVLVLYVQSAYEKDEPWRMQRENRKVFLRVCSELLGLMPKKTKGPRSKSR